MRWHCPKSHPDPAYSGGFVARYVSMDFDSFGAWAFDQICHDRDAMDRLVRWGLVDAADEYSPVFWRWDFWNANLRAQIIRHEREAWERKRRRTIAKWGEGSA